MFKRIGCLLVLGAFSLFAATDVSITGTVKDGSGTAIAGAIVTLAKGSILKDTTDAQGAFALTGSISVGVTVPYAISIQEASTVTSNGKAIQFMVNSNVDQADIEIYSSSGSRVTFLQLGKLVAGRQSFSLPVLVPGFYAMKISLDRVTTTTKLMNTGNGFYVSNVASDRTEQGSLLKSAAAATLDTLIASKSGYTTYKQALTTYTKSDIAVVLTKIESKGCTPANLPEPSALTVNKKLPSPFKFFNGTEMTRKDEWPCRRQEILDMSYKYMYGQMPPFAAPDVEVKGTVSASGVKAEVSYKGKSATLNFGTSGSGSILLISMGSGINPPSTYKYRTFSVNNTQINGWKTNCSSLFGMSPCGEIALGWGCNILCRAISSDPSSGIDSNKIMTTGCSNTAKAAFLAAVFCEGIDLTVVVESGGLGDACFRVAEYLYNEKNGWKCSDPPQGVWKPDYGSQWLAEPYMDATVSAWVVKTPSNIYKLPYDQHSLAACIAPRAACLLTNQNGQAGSGEWCHLNGTGSAISYWAAEPVWNALGVPENFGGRMYTESGSAPMHCGNPASATQLANEFFKRVFDGDKNAKTDVLDANDQDLQMPKSQWEATWAEGDMLTKKLQ